MSIEPNPDTSRSFADHEMTTGEVKSRAAAGAVLNVGRGLALQVIGFLGSLVLARLLAPEDFGIVAIGLTVVSVAQVLAGSGLASGLIAREQPPSVMELRALMGLQLLVMSGIAAIAAGVAVVVGEAALVTALMMLAIPLRAFEMPATILFQRRLEFFAQVKVEIAETIAYLMVAIPLAALGLEAWSLAIATVVRALVRTVVALVLARDAWLLPSIHFSRVRSLLGFGWRFQANGVSQLIAGTALTAGIGAVAGLGAVGLWSFASRMLAIPQLLFDAMWRVGFPVFSRLVQSDANREMGGILERTVGTFSVAAAATSSPLVAASPALIPLLFGPQWTDVSLILPGAMLALTIAGPIGIVSSSYLFARGDATTGLVSTTVAGVTRLIVTLPLLPWIDVAAIGVGWVIGAAASMVITLPHAKRACGARLAAPVVAPAATASVSASLGWLIAEALGVTLLSALTAGLSAAAVWTLLMVVLAPRTLKDGAAMARRVLSSAVGRARPRNEGAPLVAPSSGG